MLNCRDSGCRQLLRIYLSCFCDNIHTAVPCILWYYAYCGTVDTVVPCRHCCDTMHTVVPCTRCTIHIVVPCILYYSAYCSTMHTAVPCILQCYTFRSEHAWSLCCICYCIIVDLVTALCKLYNKEPTLPVSYMVWLQREQYLWQGSCKWNKYEICLLFYSRNSFC